MNEPRKYRCPKCSTEVEIAPTVLVVAEPEEGQSFAAEDLAKATLAINRPIPYCAQCPGEPEMERAY